jgi:hypothetical protein
LKGNFARLGSIDQRRGEDVETTELDEFMMFSFGMFIFDF